MKNQIGEQYSIESEEIYKSLFESNYSIMLLIDPENGDIKDANISACNYYGWSHTDICTKKISEINTLSPEEINQQMEVAIKRNKNVFLFKHMLSSGEVRDVEVYAGPIKFRYKTLLYSIVHDITERKIVEESLRNNEERYRFMFHNNPQPSWIYDLETLRFLEVNEAAINLYGYTKNEFLSMTLMNICPEKDIPALIEDVKQTNKPLNYAGEWRHIKKNGEIIYVEIISHSVLFNGRESRHVLVRDITDRKLAQDELIKANNELKQLHDNLDVAVFSVDIINNKMLYASIAHKSVFGYEADDFLKNPQLWYEIIIPEDKHIVDAGYPILFSGQKLNHEYRISYPTGEIQWVEAKMNPTLDEKSQLIRIDGIASNVTQRKKIENALVEAEINFRNSISESPVGIRIVTLEGKTIYVNNKFLEIYEFDSLEEFINTPSKKRYTSESYKKHVIRNNDRKNGKDTLDYEIEIIRRNSEIRYVKVSRKEILWNGLKHFQVINIDITDQRNAEEVLRKLTRAVEQSPDAICITDTNGIIEYINPRTIELTGHTTEELIGKKTSIFSSGKTSLMEYKILWETIKSGKVWSGELQNKKKNNELYWELTTISPIFNKENFITHFLSIKVDITQRRINDEALKHSKEQLRKFASHLQNVREEEKVTIAREIHDDLGQVLVALKIDMGLLKKEIIKNESVNCSNQITPKFDKIIGLIENTIKIARRIMSGLRPELLEMHGFDGAIKAYLSDFEKRYSINCEYEYNISNTELNSQQSLALYRILQEAMNNIVKHAKATFIKIQLRKQDENIVMEIIDNGIGFDKLSSGRDDSYGMIGMQERVVLLEGKLNITSEIGNGTIVRVELPYIIN